MFLDALPEWDPPARWLHPFAWYRARRVDRWRRAWEFVEAPRLRIVKHDDA